jgi:multicomponent K+:H+ antiporter subunit C
MELLYASCVGVLVSCGVFLILRARTFPVVLGLTMFSYAVNLFLFSSGRLSLNKAAVLGYSSEYADPLPQALVLTAIVIGFAMTAFVVILAIRGQVDLGNDHVDGQVPDNIFEQKNDKEADKSTNNSHTNNKKVNL